MVQRNTKMTLCFG